MKVFKEFFLFAVMLMCICYKLTNAVNVVLKLDSREHTIFYDVYQVEFSDVDMLKIMYHANFVAYCGNSVVKYLHRLPQTTLQKAYIVKNIDFTFFSPLRFLDSFKLVGAITKYGDTSMQITIKGVSNQNNNFELMKKLFKILRTKDIGAFLRSGLQGNTLLEKIQEGATDTETAENATTNDIPEDAADVNEYVLHTSEANAAEKKVHNPLKHKRKLSTPKGKCIHYFTAIYTLVKVNEYGQKESINESFKNSYPPMTKEDFESFLSIIC